MNTGVASEVTGVLGECGLRKRGTKRPLKPRGRFRVYRSNVSSATVEEAAPAYGVQEYEYDDYDDLLSNVRAFVDTVDERSRGQGGVFPLLHRSEL
ncbi:DUF7509 family protein [Natronomonas amylolytica]|uniref:DUF7509 family protein n=1 Tax=Natronomonas amylolytica TaxID=3108498 RepID=UPI00300BD1A0